MNLWSWMESYEERTGGKLLAIAHNGNMSNGNMFPMVETFHGRPMSIEAYVESRIRWEPLYEATQIKGDGEAHPLTSRPTTSSPTTRRGRSETST